MAKPISVQIVGDYDSKDILRAQRDLEMLSKQTRTASQKFTAMGDGFASFGKKMSLFATLPIAAFGVAAFKAAEDAAVADRRLAQVAKSMGLVSGAFTGGVARLNDYSAALQRQIGVEDESIKLVQAKLMTFKAIGQTMNQVGGSMDRATIAAYDLASAGFGSAETNATQLGKALQDPIKGLTALTRSGVTFTESEKERIKAMVAAGQTTEAQNAILQAIETQVGGTAAATVTDTAKMSVAFSELQESVGNALAPIVTAISEKLIPFLDKLAKAFGSLSPGAKNAVVSITALVAAIGPLSFIIGKTITGLVGMQKGIMSMAGVAQSAVSNVKNLALGFSNAGAVIAETDGKMLRFGAAIKTGMTAVVGLIADLGRQTAALIVQGAQYVATTAALIAHKVASAAVALATGVMTAAQYALNLAMTANPIGLIVVGLVALGAAFVLLVTKVDGFRNILVGAFNAIKAGVEAMWNVVKAVFTIFVKAFFGYVGAIVDGAALMFGWIPGIGPKLKEAQTKFRDFADGVVASLEGTKDPSGKAGEAAGNGFIKGFKAGVENAPTTIIKVGEKVATTLGKAVVDTAVLQGPLVGAAAVSSMLGTQGALNAAYAAGEGIGISYNNGVASVVDKSLGPQNTGLGMTAFENSARNIAKGMGAATKKIFAAVTGTEDDTENGSGAAADVISASMIRTISMAAAKVKKFVTSGLSGFGAVGIATVTALIDGITYSKSSKTSDAIKKVLQDGLAVVADAVTEARDFGKSISDGIMSGMDIGLAASDFEARQDNVKQSLKDLTEFQKTLTAEVTDAQRQQLTELQGIYQTAQAEAAASGASIIDTFVAQAAKAGEFAAKLETLLKAGLNQITWKQIAGMNADQGIKIADAFIDGNITQNIARANDAVGAAKSVADQVGAMATKTFMQAGIEAAIAMLEAIAKALTAGGTRKSIMAAIAGLKKDMADTFNMTPATFNIPAINAGAGVAPSATASSSAFDPYNTGNPAFDAFNRNLDFLLGDIPSMATGGIVNGPTMALIGESGPEAVIPLSKAGKMGGTTINLTVNAGMGTQGAEVGRQIVDALKAYERRNGSVYVAA